MFCLARARRATGFPCLLLLVLQGMAAGMAAGTGTSNFSAFFFFFSWFLWTLHLWVQWSKFRAIFQHCQASVSRWPIFVFLFVELRLTFFHISGHWWSGLDVVCFFCQPLSGPCVWMFFYIIGWTVWNPSTHLIDLGLFRCSTNRQCGVQALSKVVLVALATSMYRCRIGNDSSLNT